MLKSKIFICGLLFAILASGCASIKDTVKCIAGVSTKVLEDGRKTAVKKTFNYDYFTCYTKTSEILKGLNAYIYTQDIKKQIIAIYVSQSDTTPVGFFFKEVDQNTTQIEVSSPSTYAKEYFSAKLFSALEKPVTIEKPVGQP
ncbi:MAG: DUF3568 family protein [Candidatus Omnitrophota bacterium]|nr:DUF3568 family protein [Candidatus Omnitrophota bacterium]